LQEEVGTTIKRHHHQQAEVQDRWPHV
jgi:hypothetical protein